MKQSSDSPELMEHETRTSKIIMDDKRSIFFKGEIRLELFPMGNVQISDYYGINVEKLRPKR